MGIMRRIFGRRPERVLRGKVGRTDEQLAAGLALDEKSGTYLAVLELGDRMWERYRDEVNDPRASDQERGRALARMDAMDELVRQVEAWRRSGREAGKKGP